MKGSISLSKIDQIKYSSDYKTFRDDLFWKEIPGWKNIPPEIFNDYQWQSRNSVRKIDHIKEILGKKLPMDLMYEIIEGQKITPMNIRITPYIFSLIDWEMPYTDPLIRQLLPLKRNLVEDHPKLIRDSLAEEIDSPVQFLTHRYSDKVLFLPLATCPVYCSYCTRSRIVGGTTDRLEKETYGANQKKWDQVFEYIKNRNTIEDVVISGGDAYNLTPSQIKYIGESLLLIPHIRRIRYATKGLAVLPQKILNDNEWVDAISSINKLGRNLNKQVAIHTHFSHTHEITAWTKQALNKLFDLNIIVRNQSVLQTGVNNTPEEMIKLLKKLSYINITPYYIYMHDMVPGCEHLRTSLYDAIELEKQVRGTLAGFNTPTFVCDLPQGGGKRHVASFEFYDKENGISVWKAPFVKPNQLFTYFDPIKNLSSESKERWKNEKERNNMIAEALNKANNESNKSPKNSSPNYKPS